jgi:hypothetical protein
MKAADIIKTAAWMALFAGISAAGIKYVAVVESDIDESSGASEKISRADARLVTAELRREAVKNLPPSKYSIMTSETVQSMSGAVLEECADENCVISLGSKIGADYIVRGTISKLGAKFTLSVEIYETENGTLLASSDPIRSESIDELVDKTAAACAEMYRKFAEAQDYARKPPALEHPSAATPASEEPIKAQIGLAPQTPKLKPSFLTGLALDVVGAGLLAYGVYQNGDVKTYVNDGVYEDREKYENAKKSAANRNIGYIIGGAFLLAGISVHIFF